MQNYFCFKVQFCSVYGLVLDKKVELRPNSMSDPFHPTASVWGETDTNQIWLLYLYIRNLNYLLLWHYVIYLVVNYMQWVLIRFWNYIIENKNCLHLAVRPSGPNASSALDALPTRLQRGLTVLLYPNQMTKSGQNRLLFGVACWSWPNIYTQSRAHTTKTYMLACSVK